jgi:hypothetical protein
MLLFLLPALLAARLAAQDPRLVARLGPGPRSAVERLVARADSSGLPAEPLIKKALEGVSKGADSARIVSAVQDLLTNLTRAREVFGAEAQEPELVAGAAALRAGASASNLARLSALRHGSGLTVPVSVLADLLASGLPRDQAWKSVYDMANQGANDAAFLALRDRLTRPGARAPGLPPPVEHPPDAPMPGTRSP